MDGILKALVATALYGVQNVLIREHLTSYNAAVLLVGFYGTGMVISLVLLLSASVSGRPVVTPQGVVVWVVIAAGAAYCVADYFMISGLKSATSVTVTSVLLLTPVFAGIMTFYMTGGVPNRYQVAAFLLVVVALALFTKGEELQRAGAAEKTTSSAVAVN